MAERMRVVFHNEVLSSLLKKFGQSGELNQANISIAIEQNAEEITDSLISEGFNLSRASCGYGIIFVENLEDPQTVAELSKPRILVTEPQTIGGSYTIELQIEEDNKQMPNRSSLLNKALETLQRFLAKSKYFEMSAPQKLVFIVRKKQ